MPCRFCGGVALRVETHANPIASSFAIFSAESVPPFRSARILLVNQPSLEFSAIDHWHVAMTMLGFELRQFLIAHPKYRA